MITSYIVHLSIWFNIEELWQFFVDVDNLPFDVKYSYFDIGSPREMGGWIAQEARVHIIH